jgi:hypothetical protein
MPIGNLYARAEAVILTTLGVEPVHLALEAASDRAAPMRNAPEGHWRLTGTFVWRGQARQYSIKAEFTPGQIRLYGALPEHLLSHDERDYDGLMDAVAYHAEHLFDDLRSRLALLERLVAASGRAAASVTAHEG